MELLRGVTQLDSLKRGAIKYAVSGLYYLVNSLDPELNMLVLNYGFDDGKEIPLDPKDRSHRYRLSLYHHVVSAVDLNDKNVLEVSSGRGGGAAYIAKHFHPRSVHGIDLSKKAVQFCQRHYDVPGLSFSKGDAESLDCEDNSYDVVVNIESSHNYPDMRKFLEGVYRVLKPEGYFLLADIRPAGKIEQLRELLKRSGFRMVSEENITPNVLSSLDKDNDQKLGFIEHSVPKFLRRPFSIFAGIKGTRFYNQLQSGDLSYLNLVLQTGLKLGKMEVLKVA